MTDTLKSTWDKHSSLIVPLIAGALGLTAAQAADLWDAATNGGTLEGIAVAFIVLLVFALHRASMLDQAVREQARRNDDHSKEVHTISATLAEIVVRLERFSTRLQAVSDATTAASGHLESISASVHRNTTSIAHIEGRLESSR